MSDGMVATCANILQANSSPIFCATLGILKNIRIFGRRGVDTTSSIKTLGSNEGAMKLVCFRIGKPLASDLFLDRDWVIEKRKNILSFSLKSKKNMFLY